MNGFRLNLLQTCFRMLYYANDSHKIMIDAILPFVLGEGLFNIQMGGIGLTRIHTCGFFIPKRSYI